MSRKPNATLLVPLMLAMATGCSTQDAAPTTPGAPAPQVRVPGPELGGVKQDLKDIRKDLAPPTVAGPGQPAASAPQPGKTE